MKLLNIAFVFALCCSQTIADEKTLYIGLDADMSAVAQTGGIAIQRGAEIAITEINASGGVLGKHLELIVKDHRGNPARGIANIHAFAKQEDLLAVLGGVHTPVALKELPAIHEHKIIYLDPWAAGTPIVDNGFEPNYVFRVSVRDKEAGKVFINYAQKLGVKRVGLLLEQTGWGRSNVNSISEAAESKGIEVGGTEWFNWGQTSVSAELKSLKREKVEAIILVANAPEGAMIVKEISRDPILKTLPIISHWGIASGKFAKEVGTEILQSINLAVLQTYSFKQARDEKINQEVLDQYRSLFDESATASTIPAATGVAHAYDLVHLLAIAVKNANSEDREKIRDALEHIPEYPGLVKHYKPPFSAENHDALLAEDYILSRFDESGWLTPIQ